MTNKTSTIQKSLCSEMTHLGGVGCVYVPAQVLGRLSYNIVFKLGSNFSQALCDLHKDFCICMVPYRKTSVHFKSPHHVCFWVQREGQWKYYYHYFPKMNMQQWALIKCICKSIIKLKIYIYIYILDFDITHFMILWFRVSDTYCNQVKDVWMWM